jgi:hypothetical protein
MEPVLAPVALAPPAEDPADWAAAKGLSAMEMAGTINKASLFFMLLLHPGRSRWPASVFRATAAKK